jgi:CHAD domain-containing protein
MNAAVNHATAGPAMPMSGMTSPRQCVRRIITERLRKLLSHEHATLQDTDIEALHDMRVASRRLREAFEIFEFCFSPKPFQKFYRRIRLLTRALGRVRNTDVAMTYFKNLGATTDDILVQVALEDVLRRLVRRRRRARLRLVDGLDEVRVSQMPAEVAGVFARIENVPVRYQRGPKLSIVLARRELLRRVREFFSAKAAVTGEGDQVNLHKVRIAVKKLRYAIETLDYAVGESVVANLQELKQLQETLGELRDRDVFAGLVSGRLTKLQGRPHGTLLANGLHSVLNMILIERRQCYREYQALATTPGQPEWLRRFVPPAATRPESTRAREARPHRGSQPNAG